jgi:hypothetical protein
VEATSSKASRTLGFLHPNFRDCNKSVREQAYTTMVYDDSGIQTKPCITLYMYIIMSLWLFQHSFRGSHPNDFTIAVTHPGVLSL